MDPVQQARLNPEATNVQYATEGLFRVSGDPTKIYKRIGNTVQAFDPVSLLNEQERQQLGNYGAQSSTALERLKSQYGFDINSLSQVNLGDMFSADRTLQKFNEQSYANTLNDINQFITAKPSTLQSATINATPNTLATPAPGTQQNNAPSTVQPSQQQQAVGQAEQPQPGQTNPNANFFQQGQGGNPQPGQQPQTQPTQQPAGNMSTNSIVDYLNSVGQNSSFTARQALAQKVGISGYTGTATQNSQLLQAVRGQSAGTSPTQVSAPLPVNKTAQTGAVNVPQTTTGKTPTQNVIDTYTEVFKQLGLTDIKTAYEKTLKDQQELTNQMNDEIANVNNDPWLTEGVRVQRAQKIKSKYEQRLDTLSNFAKLYDAQYEQGQKTAQYLVGQIETNTNKALELAQKELEAMDALANTPDIKEYNLAKAQGYTGKFTDFQREMANLKAKASGGGTSSFTPYQKFQAELSLGGKVDKLTASAKEVVNRASLATQAFNRFDRGETKDLNATSQVIITNFNKILDPTSVVRESEYSRSPEGQSYLNQLEGKLYQIQQGGAGLTYSALKEFVALGNEFAKRANDSIEAEKQRAKQQGSEYGLNTNYIGGGYTPGQDSNNPLGI